MPKYKTFKPPKIKTIPIRFNFDTDRDGVKDYKDCRPFNTHKQHARPSQTTRKRLEKLPIYFVSNEATPYDVAVSKKKYTVRDKKVPKTIHQTRQRFYSVIKKRPDVLGEMERTTPDAIVFTKRGGQEEGYFLSTDDEELVVSRLSSRTGHPYREEEAQESAGTIHHELEHVKQSRRWKGKPKLKKKMTKGSYSKRREEVLAREAEEKAAKARYEYQSIPYEFSPRIDERKEEWEKYAKEHPAEEQRYKRKQKKFFEGYQEMIEDIEG